MNQLHTVSTYFQVRHIDKDNVITS